MEPLLTCLLVNRPTARHQNTVYGFHVVVEWKMAHQVSFEAPIMLMSVTSEAVALQQWGPFNAHSKILM